MSDDDDYPKCASCGKPFVEHDGIIRTCKALQEAKAELERIKAAKKKARSKRKGRA